MARKIKNVHLEKQQVKAKKQKRLAIILSAFLALVLVYEVPHTMKLMSPQAKAPVVSSANAAPAVNPQATTTTPLPAAAQAEAPATPAPAAQAIVAAVPPQPDAGQLTQFQMFASKDPFNQSVQKTGSAAPPSKPSSAKTPPPAASKPPKAPPAPPPGSAVISVNGELVNATLGADFPGPGTTIYAQVGSALFHLVSLTEKTATVAIAGGSYADGAPTLTLTVGKPVTLQNTADGSRYVLILEPQNTQVTQTTTTTGASTPPAGVTTTASVVPSSSGG